MISPGNGVEPETERGAHVFECGAELAVGVDDNHAAETNFEEHVLHE